MPAETGSALDEFTRALAKEEAAFLDEYPNMIGVLTQDLFDDPDTLHTAQHFKKSLEYNVPLGKKRRAMFMIFTYRHLHKGLTETDFRLARVVGWSIEIIQGCFLVADDIVDKSSNRRGQACWSKVVRDPLHGLNDVFHLESAAFELLDIFNSNEDYYVDILMLFRKMIYMTVFGQNLDLRFAQPTEVDFTHFTLETYCRIVKYKTAYYTFYFPAAAGMTMAGIKDPKYFKDVEVLLLKMGEMFQIQDDMLDCYGDPDYIGKNGTDIQDNKCTWLIVTALEHATDDQIKILKENYGSWDEVNIKKVKDVYRELKIQKLFQEYETKTYYELMGLIDAMEDKMPKPIFIYFLDKLYQRKK